MALTLVTKELANDPDALRALHQTFSHVEEIPYRGPQDAAQAQLYKTFRLKGQGLPDSDRYVTLLFERTLKGKARVASWKFAEENTLL